MILMLCSNTLILDPECRKYILRDPPTNLCLWPSGSTFSVHIVYSTPTPRVLLPTKILIENPVLVVIILPLEN